MRKHISKPQKPEKAAFSVKKVLIISIIAFVVMGMMGVMATNIQVKSVKVVLSSGYEKDTMTTKTKIADILEETGIELLEGEYATPDLEEDISDNRTIIITKGEKTETVTPESFFSEEDIMASYESIVEKKVTVEEEIPFETETKDVSNGSETTQNKVVQAGENGIKEVTYDIKYQNGEEKEKEIISEKIIKEPVNKIVEVRTKAVTSRGNTSRASSGTAAEAQAYAQQRCAAYGWSDSDFNCLVALWNKESGWNVNAHNSSSGAHGIPQALPASKMASAGSDYLTSYQTQVNWGLNYIKSRYGTPTAAWNHSVSTGWY